MYLSKLDVRGIRNIKQAALSPSPSINIIYGRNGSGKTSLLEAVYLLGRGRSFRTTRLKLVINTESPECLVFAVLHNGAAGQGSDDIPMGVRRSGNGEFQFKIAGQQVYTASLLAEKLPILVVNSDSFALIDGSPGDRRRFLDWGVFHVEQPPRELWRKHQRVLKQRNNLLRRGKIDSEQLRAWDKEFAELSEQIADFRDAYFARFVPECRAAYRALGGEEVDLEVELFHGWRQKGCLRDELRASFQRDQQSKTTNVGAHRADLKLKCHGQLAAEVLSRGQMKLLVLAMQLAQGRILRQTKNRDCIYLLDDLAAELDQVNLARCLELLADQQDQVFLTGTHRQVLVDVMPKGVWQAPAVFHVEQGEISVEVVAEAI